MLGGSLMFQLGRRPQSAARGQQSPCRLEGKQLHGQLISGRYQYCQPVKPVGRSRERLSVRAATPASSSVKILIQGRHVQVTDSIDAYVVSGLWARALTLPYNFARVLLPACCRLLCSWVPTAKTIDPAPCEMLLAPYMFLLFGAFK